MTTILELFKIPTARNLALRELEDARRELLRAYTAQEYSSALVTYGEDRVARLTATIQEVAA